MLVPALTMWQVARRASSKSTRSEAALCSNAASPEPPLERKIHPIELVVNPGRESVVVEKPVVRHVKRQRDLRDVNSEQQLLVAGRRREGRLDMAVIGLATLERRKPPERPHADDRAEVGTPGACSRAGRGVHIDRIERNAERR